MEERLKELAITRNKVERLKEQVQDIEDRISMTQWGKQLREAEEALNTLKLHQADLEQQIKHDAEVEFVHNHLENTKPYEGIQIKQFQVVRILDERAAKRWAGENAPGALSIKTAQFNKIAKALDGLEFVKIDKEYRAQIASDLSMYEGDKND